MEHEIIVGEKILTLFHQDLLDEVDIESDISIDYSNLAGEAMVTPLISNAVGMHKADLEKEVKMKELQSKIFEDNLKRKLRKEASLNAGQCSFTEGGTKVKYKYSEKAIEKTHYGEKEWQKIQNELFIKQNFLSKLELFYWKIQDKIEKLKIYQSQVTPEECTNELLEKTLEKIFKKKEPLITKTKGGLS